MQRRIFNHLFALCLGGAGILLHLPVLAADEPPDAMIQRLSTSVLDNIRSDKSLQGGDISHVMSLVDTKIMPSVNFQRMTASAVGPAWRQATPEQQKRLQEEFKTAAGAHLRRCAGTGQRPDHPDQATARRSRRQGGDGAHRGARSR